jgi:hypothetical protein
LRTQIHASSAFKYNDYLLRRQYGLPQLRILGGDIMCFDDFDFDLDPFELGFALGFGEEIAEEELRQQRLIKELDDDENDDKTDTYP